MTELIGLSLRRSLAALPGLQTILHTEPRAPRAPAADDAIAAALATAGAWFFQIDAERLIRDVFPVDRSVKAALVGRDIRSFIDPLDPLDEHPRMTRAFRDRTPFRDLLMAADFGSGNRLLRISGEPVYGPDNAFAGYRGLAVDVTNTSARPDTNVGLLAPDLRQALTNTLGVIAGFAQFLAQDMPADSAQAVYAARILVAAGTARNIVMASRDRGAARGVPEAGDPPCMTHPERGPARVLVVHSIPEIGDLLSIAFDRAGFEAAVCRDGAEAAEILDEDPGLWDVLVTTGVTGAALIRHGRSLNHELLCVVCDEPAAAALAEAEADICWLDPADATSLARMVRVQLGG